MTRDLMPAYPVKKILTFDMADATAKVVTLKNAAGEATITPSGRPIEAQRVQIRFENDDPGAAPELFFVVNSNIGDTVPTDDASLFIKNGESILTVDQIFRELQFFVTNATGGSKTARVYLIMFSYDDITGSTAA